MRWLKIVALILAGLLALLVVAVAVFWWRFDPNAWRAMLGARVQQLTGRQLTIDGNLHLVLAPELVLEANGVRLADAPGFGPGPFLSAERLRASLKLWPLLRGRVDAGELRIDGLDLRLRRAAAGRTNWQDLLERLPKSDEGPANYSLAALQLRRAAVSYTDAAAGRHWRIGDLELSTDRIAPPEPFAIVTQFTVAEGEAPPFARLGLKSRVVVDTENEQYRLEAPRIDAEWRRTDLPTLQAVAEAQSLALDLRQGTAAARAVRLEAGGARLLAEVGVTQLTATPEIDGSVSAAPFALRETLQAFGIAVPVTSDPTALSRAAFTAKFALQGSAIRLDDLVAELDDSKLQGRLVADFSTEPAIAFELAADRMDVDRYLSPAARGKPKKKPAATDSTTPLESLRKLQVEGVLEVGQGRVAGMQIEDARIVLTAHDNRVHLQKRPAAATQK